tara:strand:- start:16 stop:609 length:594 start_codon:yes stop_codon:yes gene_type:complete
MELMSRYEDNHFDLAIVDPPYGAFDKMQKGGGSAKKQRLELSKWDIKPTREYFTELKRVSKNRIVWGANYFINDLPLSSRWLCWDKGKLHHFPEFELAWMSFNKPSRMFRYHRVNAYINDIDIKIHPTQKPVKLYEWLLMNYAKEGDKILDTHLGSGSIALACHNLKYDLTACELDEEYYKAAMKRITKHKQQLTMF